MEKNAKNFKQELKSKGVFYTPIEFTNILKDRYLKDFEYSEVYDPTCGQGNMLSVFDDNIKKYGQEIYEEEVEKANKLLVNADIRVGDTLTHPEFKNRKFDVIMANPPFSISWEQMPEDERFCNLPALPPKSKADFAFITHILHYLKETGIAIVICFPGITYRGNSEYKIRRWYLENNYIDEVLGFDGIEFADTKISICVLVLRKNRKKTSINFGIGKIENNKLVVNEREVEFNEIKENDYILSASNYISTKEEKEIVWTDEDKFNQVIESFNRLKLFLNSGVDINTMIFEMDNELQNKNEYIKLNINQLESFKNIVEENKRRWELIQERYVT